MNMLKQFRHFVKNNTPTLLLWAIFTTFLEVFSIYFISQERYVYAWDYATYFRPYISTSDIAKTGIINFSNNTLASQSKTSQTYYPNNPLFVFSTKEVDRRGSCQSGILEQ